MKKLIVFAVALVAAVFAQAANLDWQYNTTVAEDGATVYVLLGTTATTDWASEADVAAAASGSGTVAKSGRNYFAQGMLTDVSKDAASVYYVVVSGDTYGVTSVADMKSSVYDPAAQESSSGTDKTLSSASLTVTGKSFGGNPPPGPMPGDTPEPTSGLLLLVGGAALALRRKQK